MVSPVVVGVVQLAPLNRSSTVSGETNTRCRVKECGRPEVEDLNELQRMSVWA